MDDHDDGAVDRSGLPDVSVPRGNPVRYLQALATFRNNYRDDPAAYLAAAIDAALLLTKPGPCTHPVWNPWSQSELWAFGAAVQSGILDIAANGNGITEDQVLEIVAARYQFEFGRNPEEERDLAAIDSVYSEMIDKEFGVGTSRPAARAVPAVRELADLISPHARLVVDYWAR